MKSRIFTTSLLVITLLLGTAALPCFAQSPDSPEKPEKKAPESQAFMRTVRADDDTPVAMETAIVRYVPADYAKKLLEKAEIAKNAGQSGKINASGSPLIVDMIGAVHIAEPKYFDRLNKYFASYDSVLYELVAAEKGQRPEPGTKSNHPVSIIQQTMRNVLELEFQLDGIDYTVENMVHADMTSSEFAQSMKDRNESFMKLFFRMMADAMAKDTSNQPSDIEILMALFSSDRPVRLKRLLASQFEDMEASMAVLSGPNGSTLVTERNKVALKVLQEQIDAGDTKLAIFYGAGHMADFNTRLREEFDLVPLQTRWLKAWNMPLKKPQADR